jgi:hypothetical protein
MAYGPVSITSNKIKEPVDWFISLTPMALCPEDGLAAKDEKYGHYPEYKAQEIIKYIKNFPQ